ncbi:MAG: hypothetical protein QJT81_00095 [Candidatus Thiothrix putei]|uniref:Uncharacterized protein n=1 Tax=Candidatus Thiothrix putei TaxID=3080811 RepID=A0AA95KML0_9GAMM|nr:MAG: hypothetical protein QJT81_00095 [Candidatus Thiothrix putei]
MKTSQTVRWSKILLSAGSLIILMASCTTGSLYTERGSVTGYTISMTAISPIASKSEPGLKGGLGRYPNMRLCFLAINKKNNPQIFTVRSNNDGFYHLEIPEGEYIVKEEFSAECEYFGRRSDENSLFHMFFDDAIRYDENGKIIFTREPDVIVKAGQQSTYDHSIRLEVY